MQPVSPYMLIPTDDCPAKIESEASLDKAELSWGAEDENGNPSSVVEVILPEPEPEPESAAEAVVEAKVAAVESKTESRVEAKAEEAAAEAAPDATVHFLIGTGNFRVVAISTSARFQSQIYTVQYGAPAVEMIVLTLVPPAKEEEESRSAARTEPSPAQRGAPTAPNGPRQPQR